MEYILVFGSPHKALKAESILKGASIPFMLLPAPKLVVRLCDLVISVKGAELEPSKVALREGGLKLKAVYSKEGEVYDKV